MLSLRNMVIQGTRYWFQRRETGSEVINQSARNGHVAYEAANELDSYGLVK